MKKNTIIGIAGLIISAIYGYGITGLKNPSEVFMAGTTVFPIFITIGAVVFSLIILIRGFLLGDEAEVLKVDPKVMKVMGIYTGIFIIYTMVFNKLGFLISTILMLTSILFVLNRGKKQRIINLLIGVLFPTISYILFAKIFTISLPRGILPF
jgi:putative tricarboxylic transport membrane protein